MGEANTAMNTFEVQRYGRIEGCGLVVRCGPTHNDVLHWLPVHEIHDRAVEGGVVGIAILQDVIRLALQQSEWCWCVGE